MGIRYLWGGCTARNSGSGPSPPDRQGRPDSGDEKGGQDKRPGNELLYKGPPISTDFREIRDYQTGDPMKLINWKATARIGRVLVNEFEREGKKTVLFVVDAREAMKIGIESESPYEHAMNLVASMAHRFLRKDYHMGLYLLGGAKKFLPPATGGPRQLHTMVRTMMDFERVQTEEESFADAIKRLKRILVQYTPLVIYVSNVLDRTAGGETRRGGLLTMMAIHRGQVQTGGG